MRDEPNHGGTFDASRHWKKLRKKHNKTDAYHSRTGRRQYEPEVYKPNKQTTLEGSERAISKELYDLNYKLAFGKITQAQYDKLREELGE